MMKKFLLKVVIFFTTSAALITSFVALRMIFVRGFEYDLPKEVHCLFIGDSRFRVGVDDRILPHTKNVSADADNYLTAFLRIKFLLKDSNSVDTIFVVFSPDIMGKDADSRIYENYLMAGKVPLYFPLYSFREWETYFGYSPAKLLHNIVGRPFRLFSGIFSKDAFCRDLGGFRISTGNNLQAGIEKHAGGSRNKGQVVRYGNKVSLEYFSKIRDYCAERKIRLVGVALPHYLAGTVFDLDEYRETLQTRYPDFEVWDYLEMKFPDECWQDINHLNYKGAKIFTEELYSRMKKEGILSE